jgi:secreted protein with Ig-like and vWFA domain
VVKTLRPQDRLSILAYDDRVNVVCELQQMDEANQAKTVQLIDEIHTGGATDIYTAVEKAIQIIEARKEKSRNPAIMLFTDGQPNRSPPEGEIAAILKLNTKCPIHTFGFGYNLNSGLLLNMARLNGGMNCFIPDATFVGTTFVNAISNIKTTAAVDVILKMNVEGFESVSGDLDLVDNV